MLSLDSSLFLLWLLASAEYGDRRPHRSGKERRREAGRKTEKIPFPPATRRSQIDRLGNVNVHRGQFWTKEAVS